MAKHTNRVKAKIWTGTMTCELDGPLWGSAVSIFDYIKDDEDREKAFQRIKAIYEAKQAETTEA